MISEFPQGKIQFENINYQSIFLARAVSHQ